MAIEYWMNGPVENIPALLQPVAHALLQANREVHAVMRELPEDKLWDTTAGIASPGFHLQHMRGVIDRLFTYARAELLSPEQLSRLTEEGKPVADLNTLLFQLDEQIKKALVQLSQTDPNTLIEFRGVGRKQLPSTVIGCLFHAAEHTMRHTGQLLVTVNVLK